MATFHVRVRSLTGAVHSISMYDVQRPEQAIDLARFDVQQDDPGLFQRVSNGRWEAEQVSPHTPAPERPEMVNPAAEVRVWSGCLFALYVLVVFMSLDSVSGGPLEMLDFLRKMLHWPALGYLLALVLLQEWERARAS